MKPSPHRQAILVFGIVAPLIVITVVSFVIYVVHSKLHDSFATKNAALERYDNAKGQVNGLESFLRAEDRREKVAYWNSKLELDVVESLSRNLDTLLAKFDPEVLRRTEMGQAQGSGGIGPKSNHPHSRMQLKFEGGYKPMQLLLAELEREMPHLFLESLSVSPKPSVNPDEKGTLEFSITYLCWEKPKGGPVQP